MTVLHVLAPAEFGGLERVVRALAAGLAGRGRPVHVAPVLDAGPDPERHPFVAALRERGVPVHPVVVGGREYRRERAALAGLLDRLRPGVVHTHGYRADVLDAPVARRRGIATVSTVHGFCGGGWRNRLYERLQRAAFRRFDAVVAVSRPLAAQLARGGVAERRIGVIPNAWDGGAPPLPATEARRRLGVAPGAFHVGWVGRLSPEKGADVLLDALPRCADLPLALSFVGDGPDRAALAARAARLGVAERVRWQGRLDDAARLFPAFDLLVLSSRTEGTPMVLLEAMAAGVPIAAARVGGVPDVVGPAEALLVAPEDPAALAAALRRAHDDPAAAHARAAAARARLELAFGAEPWLRAHEALYDRLPPPPPATPR